MSAFRLHAACLVIGFLAIGGCAADSDAVDDETAVTGDSESELNASDSIAVDWKRAVDAIGGKLPDIHIYVPSRIPNGVVGGPGGKVYLDATARNFNGQQFTINFDFTKDCHGSNACTAGGIWSSSPKGFKANGKIAGVPIQYQDVTCGASCSPASISWLADDRMITISLKSTKADLIGAFRSTLHAGPR